MPLFEMILRLLEMEEPLDRHLAEHPGKQEELLLKTEQVLSLAKTGDEAGVLDMMRTLFVLLDEGYRNPTDKLIWNYEHPLLYRIRQQVIELWESERLAESKLDFDAIPEQPEEFAKWLRKYCQTHPILSHPLFDFVKEGTIDDLRAQVYFSTSFDLPQNDLYAWATIGLPDTTARIEISKNYWDEMGLGDENGCHTVWAARFGEALELFRDDVTWMEEFSAIPLDCLERFVISRYVGHSRRTWLQAIGHLGATEIYDPLLNRTFVKLGTQFGLTDEDMEYHHQHIKLDAIHSVDWLNKVVIPICEENADFRFGIARGAEMNLEGMHRSYDAILRHLMAKQHDTLTRR